MVTESRLQQGTCSTRASTSCTDKRNPSRTTRFPNATLLRTLTKIRFRSPVSRTIGKRFSPVLEPPRFSSTRDNYLINILSYRIFGIVYILVRIIASFRIEIILKRSVSKNDESDERSISLSSNPLFCLD